MTSNDQYITHRTRNAYVISICQSETSFDFSYAAQAIIIISNDITSLNKRLKWQIENKTRNFNYVKFDINSLRLIIFIDFFFVNNRNFSFQIDYVICLTDAVNQINILHWSSIKYKWMIRNVLKFELYDINHEFNMKAIQKITVKKTL